MSGRFLDRAIARESPGDVVEARLAALGQLERVRFVVAGQQAGAALGEPELLRPAGGRLAQVVNPQRDVLERPERDHSVTRTGRRLMPLKKFERSRSGGPVSSIRSVRASSSSNAIRTSILARCAPMQWWMPPGPKAMCGFGVRPTSKR